jgi:histone H3/H4
MSSEIKLSSMKRLIKRAGCTTVSNDSAEALAKILIEIGITISKDAIDYADHVGRKTIKIQDMERAIKRFRNVFEW